MSFFFFFFKVYFAYEDSVHRPRTTKLRIIAFIILKKKNISSHYKETKYWTRGRKDSERKGEKGTCENQ